MWRPVSIQLLCRTRWLSNRGFLIQELLLVLHIKHEANCGNGSKQKPHGTGTFLAVNLLSLSIVFAHKRYMEMVTLEPRLAGQLFGTLQIK
jgi:hypothetical protein